MIHQQKLQILKDVQKMVLLVGPRQSGKTFLAKDISKSFKNSLYLNFAIANNHKIEQAIEVKISDDNISKSLKSFCIKYQVSGTQVVKYLKKEYQASSI